MDEFMKKPVKPATAFAAVNVSGNPDASPASVIHLNVKASFGEIPIRYH